MGALDTPIPVTFFRSVDARTKYEEAYTPRALAERIRTVTATHKSALPLLKLARFGNEATPLRPHPDGRGRQIGGSLRHDSNLIAVSGIEVDYDSGAIPMDAAVELLDRRGIAGIVYTTASNSATSPRWRILCPLSAEVAPSGRAQLVSRLNGLFRGVFARESWAISQAYFYGSINHSALHRVAIVNGTAIDLHDDLDAISMGPDARLTSDVSASATSGNDEREDAELVRRIVSGEGFHFELLALSARYLARGVSKQAATDVLNGLMLAHPEETRNERWRERHASIPGLVARAQARFQASGGERRRSLAVLIAKMLRRRLPSAEVCVAARAEATRVGLAPEVADELLAWLQRRQSGRQELANG